MPFPLAFPSTEDLKRTLTEDEFYQLYNSDLSDPEGNTDRGKFRLVEFFENDTKKAKILDTALNLAPLIVDSATDFLMGEPIKVEVDGEENEDGETSMNEAVETQIHELIERTGLLTKLNESCALFQSIGHTHFKIYAENVGGKRKACIEEVPYDYWYPNWSGVPLGQESKDVRIVVYLDNVDANNQKTKLVYIENYYMLNGKAVCARSLWTDNGGKIGEQQNLSILNLAPSAGAIPDPKQPLTMIEDTGLTELPLVNLNVRKTVKERYGQSVLKKVLPLLHEINDRLTQLSVQFLKHLNAKLQVPASSVVRDPKTGRIQRVDMEVILAQAGDPDTKYITNDNPLIEQSFIHLEKLIRKVAKLTQTPDSFLTEDEKGGVEKAESLRTRLMNFFKRIRLYQHRYDEGIKKILRLALKIEGVTNADTLPLKITFDPGLPKEWQADVTIWGDAYAQKLASHETAVARFQGIEKEQLAAELERIAADEAKFMETQMALQPVAPDDANLPQA